MTMLKPLRIPAAIVTCVGYDDGLGVLAVKVCVII
jgi:hypothetical protein